MNGISFKLQVQTCSRAVCKLLGDDEHKALSEIASNCVRKPLQGQEKGFPTIFLLEAILLRKGFRKYPVLPFQLTNGQL